MKCANRIGAVRTAWIILAMITGGAAAARAGAVTYDINFTGTSADLPVGSFTYDAAVPEFTNFTVQWNGLLFDLTSPANSPLDDGASGPACLGGLSGAAAGFAWLNPGCQTFTFGWVANTTPTGNTLLVSFDFVEQDSSTQIGVHSLGGDTAINDDTTDRGAFTIAPASTSAPEPATFCVLLSGLGLLFLVRRSLSPKRMKTTVLIAAVSCLVYGPAARASGITYTEQSTMTGSLGATTFTNALVTIAFYGDTSNVTIPQAGVFLNTGGVGTLTIDGISGTATFTDAMGVADNQNVGEAGISDFTENKAVFFTLAPAFATYGLSTAIGPISGVSEVFNAGQAYPTDMGNLVLTTSSDNATFTAAATTVPEPVSSGVAGMGLAIIAVFKLRRRTGARPARCSE